MDQKGHDMNFAGAWRSWRHGIHVENKLIIVDLRSKIDTSAFLTNDLPMDLGVILSWYENLMKIPDHLI